MSLLRAHWQTAAHAVWSTLIVGLLGAADFYGYAVFGETPEQVAPGQQHSHIYLRFHK